MKVLVCGSRGWTDSLAVFRELDALGLGAGDVVLSGGARGPDMHAYTWAREHPLVTCRLFFPDWKTHGKRAGIVRNLEMLGQNPDRVLAFWDGASRGTGHTISEARKRGIPVEVFAS